MAAGCNTKQDGGQSENINADDKKDQLIKIVIELSLMDETNTVRSKCFLHLNLDLKELESKHSLDFDVEVCRQLVPHVAFFLRGKCAANRIVLEMYLRNLCFGEAI